MAPLLNVNSTSCTPDVVAAISFRQDRWLQATFLACIAYGIVLTLFSMCLYLVLREIYASMQDRLAPKCWLPRFAWACPRHTFILLVFLLAMTACSTMFTVSTMKVTRKVLVYTGCWDGVTTGRIPIRLDVLGNYAYVFANWGADGLLVRCSLSFFVLEAYGWVGLEMLGHLREYLTGSGMGVPLAPRASLPIRNWSVS